ncbi:hypothetical protein HD554DRAFT_447622 [Boletus coccyginus]|nr:hypothetical protein HD554DRAFT_447622 [Boletus coccyginus]
MSTKPGPPPSFQTSKLPTKYGPPLTASSPTTIPMVPQSSSRAPPGSEPPLPTTRQDIQGKEVTCYDYLRKPTTHGWEQRYVSPTTGVCRKLVVQSVNPQGPDERRIKDHTSQVNRLARSLHSMNPFSKDAFPKWVGTWMLFSLKLLLALIWVFIRIFFSGGSGAYRTGDYKPYIRYFRGQLWAARSPKEYSSRTKDKKEQNIPTHSLYPRLLMIREPGGNQWKACTDTDIITHTKFVAISYCADDMYTDGPNREREEENFIRDARAAVVQQNFNAYWLDLECLSKNPEEKKLDLYCMADIYRGAEITLIMLNSQGLDGRDGAWRRWGGRVWTFPEALLSQRLYYGFRNEAEIKPVSLHQLANHAYPGYELEQAIINGYSGKDQLDRLERLTLLKSAIWRRGITLPSQEPIPSSVVNHSTINTPNTSGPYTANRVYALMGFFDHRIQPDYSENDLLALARLSMANDNDRIVERMVSLLPTTTSQAARWYADDDVYSANLWDILPEIQVAGITKQGALVLDGCRAACIRWKDFPEVASNRSPSVRRALAGFVPYLAWPIMIFGMVLCASIPAAGAVLLLCGIGLLLLSPKLFVISEGGRVSSPQPWLIGVKGVLDPRKAAMHLYSGDTRCLDFTPSGSEFAVPDQGTIRWGDGVQYNNALAAEKGSQAGRTYTLIDTTSFTIYYFCADRPPTVCLYTGREGGLGRFVLCSERCADDELHKETVLRMPTYISQRMQLCDWVALG